MTEAVGYVISDLNKNELTDLFQSALVGGR